MSKFQIGDKVRVVKDHNVWLVEDETETVLTNDSVLTVVDNDDASLDDYEIWIEHLKDWPGDFELVTHEHEVSVLNYATGGLTSDNASVISAADGSWSIGKSGEVYLSGLGVGIAPLNISTPYPMPDFAGIPQPEIVPLPFKPDLGVYRPNLEDRKVGKVRVELVDDGFPLALREIAKVMTWAQTAKGYLDHDWQNLPNPEQGLAGATSRHRTDHIIQRQVDEYAAIECTDHESKLLHKAHEAFGVLAQLELILRGVIK